MIKTWCIIAQFLAHKSVHFASLTLTDTFIVSFSKFIDTVIMNANRANIKELFGPGARFSKVPIINGPGKLSPFTLKIEVSIVLHLTC